MALTDPDGVEEALAYVLDIAVKTRAEALSVFAMALERAGVRLQQRREIAAFLAAQLERLDAETARYVRTGERE